MRTSLATGIFALVIALAPAFVRADTKAADETLRTVTIDQLAALRTAGKAMVVDANGAETRQKYGIIPGAVLLTNYDKYDVAGQLPREKADKIVFYCANEKCMASHKAAHRAAEAGYSDVNVLPAGIMGWRTPGNRPPRREVRKRYRTRAFQWVRSSTRFRYSTIACASPALRVVRR